MKKIFKPVIILPLIVGVIIGGSISYYFGPRNIEVISQSEANEKRKIDQQAPDGTISPQEAAINIQKYKDQQIKVRGFITKVAEGQYTITSQNANEPLALNLDFSQSDVDPSIYANTLLQPNEEPKAEDIKLKDPVTVVGKVIDKKTDNNYIALYLLVNSVE